MKCKEKIDRYVTNHQASYLGPGGEGLDRQLVKLDFQGHCLGELLTLFSSVLTVCIENFQVPVGGFWERER